MRHAHDDLAGSDDLPCLRQRLDHDAVRIRDLKALVEGGNKPARRPKAKVLSAVYGVEGKFVDVRAVVQAQLERGLTVQADPAALLLKEDPAPGLTKSLKLELQIGDAKVSFSVQDGRGGVSLK